MVLLLAVAAVLTATLLPLTAYRAHPHWERVGWIPFADDRSRPWEMAANVLLFMPLGWSAARVLGRVRGTEVGAAIVAALAGGALSALVELAQVFAHGRIASATDVVMNLAGAALGAAVALRVAEAGQRPVGADGIFSSRSSSHR